MANLYLTKQRSKIRKRGKRLIVEAEGEKIADLPLLDLEQVIVIGSVGITGAMIQSLLKAGVSITYLSYYGKYRGRLVPKYSKNSIFRLKQFEAYQDRKFCLNLSKELVKGKLKNMRTFLLRESKDENRERLALSLNEIIAKIELAEDIEQLRGYEGIASKFYFNNLNTALNEEFKFEGRNRRPPRDPVNSLLSFGYSLLLNEIITALYLAGFDPYIGFYHSLKYGRPALALDLIEEFRQNIVDSTVKSVINKGMLIKDDFKNTEQGVLLKDEGRKIFLERYEYRLNTEIKSSVTNKKVSWRKIFEIQARLMSEVVSGKRKKYQAMVVR